MFRYDRPQAGRFRQFWQWNVEAIGDAGPAVDAEIIELGHRFYREAGLNDVKVFLNSIGDPVCRPAYIEALRAHFAAHEERLMGVERERLATNPAPTPRLQGPRPGRRSSPRRRPSPTTCATLARPISRPSGPTSTRSACRTAWHPRLFGASTTTPGPPSSSTAKALEGQQSALGGGGRYDGLVELLGGKPTPGIGFALGLDRVVLALTEAGVAASEPDHPTAVVCGADPADTMTRLRIATDLRAAGLVARADLNVRKLGRQLEGAARDGAHFAVIVGDELANGQVQLKDLPAATQKVVHLDDLARELARAHGSHRHGTDVGA